MDKLNDEADKWERISKNGTVGVSANVGIMNFYANTKEAGINHKASLLGFSLDIMNKNDGNYSSFSIPYVKGIQVHVSDKKVVGVSIGVDAFASPIDYHKDNLNIINYKFDNDEIKNFLER